MRLEDFVTQVPLVGPQAARKLSGLEIRTVRDLVWHIPYRYEDLRLSSPPSKAVVGQKQTVTGTLISAGNTRTRKGLWLTKALITDGSATLQAVWFNQPYLAQALRANREIACAGTVELDQGKLIMRVPEWEPAAQNLHTGRLTPIYPETAGISSKWLRSRMNWVLAHLEVTDWMPPFWQHEYQTVALPAALTAVHFPPDEVALAQARRRLAIEELLFPKLGSLVRRRAWDTQRLAPHIQTDAHKDRIQELITALPFTLTDSQNQALADVFADLQHDRPMNRLLQGDVGSGKTIVAAIILFACHIQGLDGIIMAPTEILAMQHYQTLSTLFAPFNIPVVLLTSSVRRFSKSAEPSVYVGTQALIGKRLSELIAGLVVIDEQHRFGVSQRALLRAKYGNPHVLTMTATPIPRTVALTLYGDLDLTMMDTVPSGRMPIRTILVPDAKRARAYDFIRKEIQGGRQAFIICPFIEPSETQQSVKAAISEFERLQRVVFPDLTLGMLHGKLSSRQKEEMLIAFQRHDIDILVATPVVEVGIDIPNATIIVIEGAERFGLAQLHQLRGRVGRGSHQSWCLLFSSNSNSSWKRLAALSRMNSGRELAELDLQLRGPGHVYGLKQHGTISFKVASLADAPLVSLVENIAQRILATPEVARHPLLADYLTTPVDPN